MVVFDTRLRVYGLAMERCLWMGNATSDRTVHPVHASRYTITTMDTSHLTEDGQDDDFGFEWDSDSCGARRQDSTSYPGEEGT